MTQSPFTPRVISPQTLKQAIADGGELAIVDVRETGLYARKHLYYAVSSPFWRIELLIGRLVPRRSARIVVTDLDGALAAEGAAKLLRLGYSDVSVLDGGTLAWEGHGYEVFAGVNVPSKAFGEVIEETLDTPHIDAQDLRDRLDRGDKLVIVDGRTPEEFHNFSLPGAHSVPNGELAYRIRELAPDPDTLVVVNCAGRTRSILGAQTLIDSGIPNPVVSLKDGTMAWLLSGQTLLAGRATPLPEPSPAALAAARAQAAHVAQRSGVRHITSKGLEQLVAESDRRSLYCFDVRTREEYRAGHVQAWRWAPGGQLVQATDEYIGTRHARIVLADWDGVRAQYAAAWLAQQGGFELFLYTPQAPDAIVTGDEAYPVLRDPAAAEAPWISPEHAQQLSQSGAARIFDVDRSLVYVKRHPEGASFAAPDRLAEFTDALPEAAIVIVTSSDGVLARIVAGQLAARGCDARAILGGSRAWFDLGLPTAAGHERLLTGEDDASHSGYHYADIERRNARFREYLDWEIGLVEQIRRDGDATFQLADRA